MNARLRAVKSAPKPDSPHWLNRNWQYIPTRLDSPELFRQRMRERAERAKEQRHA